MFIIQPMKRLFAGVAAALLLGAPALAQGGPHDGDYAGVLKAGPQNLHLVLHLTSDKDGTNAVLDSVDQGVSLPAAAYKADGNKASMLFLSANGELEGEFSADGKTFSGSWKQGLALPITLTRVEPAKP